MVEIERFDAEFDNGTIYVIIEYASRRDASHLGGSGSVEGLSEFRTRGGSRVNSKGGGLDEIVVTGELVRRV